MFFVIGAPVADDDLTGVFVWHDDGGHGQATPLRVGVIWFQWLALHAAVVEALVRESGAHQTLHLTRPV